MGRQWHPGEHQRKHEDFFDPKHAVIETLSPEKSIKSAACVDSPVDPARINNATVVRKNDFFMEGLSHITSPSELKMRVVHSVQWPLDRVGSRANLRRTLRVRQGHTVKKLIITSLLLTASLGTGQIFAADEATPTVVKTPAASAQKIDESKLSLLSAKVVRLVQAGIDEKVIVAYAKQNAQSKPLAADELLYLHELGVSAPVLTAILGEPKKIETPRTAPPVAGSAENVEVSANYVPQPAPQAQISGSAVISTPPAQAPVIVTQPAPPTVVYAQPAPVIVETLPPEYYYTRPSISFGFGFGHFGHHGHGHGHHSIFRHGHHGGHFGGHHGGHRGRHH